MVSPRVATARLALLINFAESQFGQFVVAYGFSRVNTSSRGNLSVQRDNLGIDYLDRRSGLINAVTLEDVQRVAKRLLDPAALLTVIVGQPEGIEPTRTKDDVPS